MDFPTDPFGIPQYHMIQVHETFKRGFESMVRHLEGPQEAVKNDLSNFLGYCRAWSTGITAHHEGEEAVLFPFLNQKMDFRAEEEAHGVVHRGLEELNAAIMDAAAEPSKYDAGTIKAILIKLKDPLFNHLDEEVEHIEPSNLRSAGIVLEEFVDVVQQLFKHVHEHPDNATIQVYAIAHTPLELQGSWPPLPWMVRKIILPYFWVARNPGYWKYAPYSVK